jgi:hypothetical protein
MTYSSVIPRTYYSSGEVILIIITDCYLVLFIVGYKIGGRESGIGELGRHPAMGKGKKERKKETEECPNMDGWFRDRRSCVTEAFQVHHEPPWYFVPSACRIAGPRPRRFDAILEERERRQESGFPL